MCAYGAAQAVELLRADVIDGKLLVVLVLRTIFNVFFLGGGVEDKPVVGLATPRSAWLWLGFNGSQDSPASRLPVKLKIASSRRALALATRSIGAAASANDNHFVAIFISHLMSWSGVSLSEP